MTSLFASLNSSQAKPPTFSNPSTTATPQPSLFSSVASKPTTTTGGLFGSASQPQSQTGTGLFGSLGTGSQPQQQQQTGGFGASGFGLGSTAQSQSTLTNPFNTSSQPLQQSSIIAPTNQAQNQQPQQNGASSAYFDTILEKSRKRALGETADEDLPQLQLGLGDLRQRIKRLAAGAPDGTVDGRAHYLLAASGVDPGAAVRDLNAFSAKSGRAERPTTLEGPDTDVEGYLANLQTQTTLSMISDGLARSVRDFDVFLDENVTMGWDDQRRRIYQHFGIKPRENAPDGGRSSFATPPKESQGGFGRSRRSKGAGLAGARASGHPGKSSFGRSGLQKSVIGAAGPIGSGYQPLFADVEKRMEADGIIAPNTSDRFFRERQSRLAEKVQNLNAARLRKRCYPILHELSRAASQGGEKHSAGISHAYGVMIQILGESSEVVSPSDPLAVKERQFADEYLDPAPNSSKNMEIRKRIISGSGRFLEKLFFSELETTLAKSPKEANLGGIPNVISKVKAYVRLRAARKDLVPENTPLQMLEEDYVWALVYFLLRTGHVQEAVEYVTAKAVAFRAIDRSFASYIMSYFKSKDRKLNKDLQERIHNEYNQRLRIAPPNSIDPFRMACYKIIGRCDLQSRAFEGFEHNWYDYLWLQFILAREVNRVDEIASEACNLATVQQVIKDIGSRYFTKTENYGIYFFIQVLGGFFEEAIEYLYPHAYPDAVHFAIALDYYGLLRVSDPESSGESLLSFTTRGLPQLNFGRMVGLYTRDFRAANVTAAVDYLTLICLNQGLPGELGRKQVALCHDALRELVLESREFALLLGDIRADGQRIKGVIEERMKLIGLEVTDDFMRTITIQAASVADDNGRTTDAVLLYHLAGEYDNVIFIINRALSEAVSVQIGQDPMRLQPSKARTVGDNTADQGDSLSLTSVDDPVVLATNMTRLYSQNRMYMDKIKEVNKETCHALITTSRAKAKVEKGLWSQALDVGCLRPFYVRFHADMCFRKLFRSTFSLSTLKAMPA
jgi:nuclear pore complex protein Nup93